MPLAQITDQLIASLINSGPFGIMVLWFMWREAKKEGDGKKIDVMIEALNHLIQMTHIEVQSRNLPIRTKEELAGLMAALEKRRKGGE